MTGVQTCALPICTVDEMAHAWINIVYMKDEDFKIEQDKRRATATQTTLGQQ